MDISAIICDEIIDVEVKSNNEETIAVSQILIAKSTCKTKSFYTLLAFLLITIVLLIDVSIYCYLIKY